MYNLLIKYSPAAWEGDEHEMDVERFYGGVLEPENVAIGRGSELSRETLRHLVGLPTLLMYEGGTPGAAAQIVRYGRITSLEAYGSVLSFTFEPDARHGYLTRDQVMAYAKHLDLGTANHTHWALKKGNIPPALVRHGVAAPPVRTPEALAAELAQAVETSDDKLAEAVRLQLARLEHDQAASSRAGSVLGGTEIEITPPLSAPKSVVAFIVGLEKYNALGGQGLPGVDYAVTDAQQFVATLKEIYGEALEEPEIFLDGEATESAIKNGLAYRISTLGPEDLFIFYYAGHGYHAPDGNRLSVADTNAFNLADTTLSVRDILIAPLRNSKVKRALAFVDACAVHLKSSGRSAVANLDPAELQTFLSTASYSAMFLSCRPGEQSYSTKVLGHGIWTYHLLKALRGEAPGAVGLGGYITDASLQDYLALSVPAFIREETNIKSPQTPQAAITATHTFAIRKIDQSSPAVPATLPDLGLTTHSQVLEGQSWTNLKRLKDWKASLRIPSAYNATTVAFVEGLVAPEVSDTLQRLYTKTKDTFGLSHREVKKADGRASGTLDTEAFRYAIEASLDPDDLNRCKTVQHLTLRLTDADTLTKVDAVFGQVFDALVAELDDSRAPFEYVVDAVEGLQKALGGSYEDDARMRRVTYTAPDGGELVIDLDKGQMRLSSGRRMLASSVLSKARALSQVLGDASVAPVLSPSPPQALPRR